MSHCRLLSLKKECLTHRTLYLVLWMTQNLETAFLPLYSLSSDWVGTMPIRIIKEQLESDIRSKHMSQYSINQASKWEYEVWIASLVSTALLIQCRLWFACSNLDLFSSYHMQELGREKSRTYNVPRHFSRHFYILPHKNQASLSSSSVPFNTCPRWHSNYKWWLGRSHWSQV